MRAAVKSCYALLMASAMLAAMSLCTMSLRAMADTMPAGPLALGSAAYQRHRVRHRVAAVAPAGRTGRRRRAGVLGFMYHDGEGVPQDYAQAAQWMRKAAE